MTTPGLADQLRGALVKLEELEAAIDGLPGEHDRLWSHLADLRLMLQRRLGRVENELLLEVKNHVSQIADPA